MIDVDTVDTQLMIMSIRSAGRLTLISISLIKFHYNLSYVFFKSIFKAIYPISPLFLLRAWIVFCAMIVLSMPFYPEQKSFGEVRKAYPGKASA